MVGPITSSPEVQGRASDPLPAARPPVPAQPAPLKPLPAATDTVKISVAAQALQEATETQAQNTKEASSGDVQARRLLAQEAAARVVKK